MDEMAPIAELVSRIRDRQLTPRELVDLCLAQIERLEPDVRAWVSVDAPGARRRADELTELAARGEWVGPLHGIPIGIKDIIDVAGWPTRAGSPLRDEHVAREDASVVARLRDAGAIILGKTVTTQFAWIDPPPTRNPWNHERSPGGSSSGSAAAVASGMCVAAIGSQTGGSIVRPASYCGICGLKPTFDRVSRHGVLPLSGSLDHVGVIGRCVEDLAAMFGPIVDQDHGSPRIDSEKIRMSPLLGRVDQFFFERASDDVRTVTFNAIQRLQNAGANVAAVRLPDSFAEVHATHRRIMAYQAAREHGELYRRHSEQFGRHITSLLQEGMAIADRDYQAALDHQRRFSAQIRDLVSSFDALVIPATDTTAPADLTSTGNPSFQSPFSYAGVPVVSIPCGVASDGLPCALQFVGRHGGETELLDIAAWCERALGPAGVRRASQAP